MASRLAATERALELDGPGPSRWMALVALALLALWLLWFTQARVRVVEVSRAARVEVQQASVALPALRAGVLARHALQLGREVRAGEVLAEIEDPVGAARRREVQAQLDAIPGRRSALQAERAALQARQGQAGRGHEAGQGAARAREGQLQAQLALALETERRLETAGSAGGVPALELARARAERQRLQAAERAARADADRDAASTREHVDELRERERSLDGRLASLQAEADALSATLARLEVEGAQFRLLSPEDGVIADTADLRPGAWVAEGQRLATLVPRGPLRLVADFDAAQALGRLQPGQPALLRLDARSWSDTGRLPAQVLRVAGEARNGLLRAELALQPHEGLRRLALQHGLSGQVEVTLERVRPLDLVWRSVAGWADGLDPRAAGAPAAAVAPAAALATAGGAADGR